MQNHVRNKMAETFFCRTNGSQVTGHFPTICYEKHAKEAKIKYLNLAEEAAFPASFAD